MKKGLKITMAVVGFVAGAIFISLFLLFQHFYNFSARVVDNVCISQVFMKDEYDLVDCTNKKVLVQDAVEWVVGGEVLYGVSEDNRGGCFIIKISDNSVRLFILLVSILII